MPPRYYLDTSVFGGVFDAEFEIESLRIFELVISGEIICVLSEITEGELIDAPERVRNLLARVQNNLAEYVPLTQESVLLAETYLNEKVVGPTSRNDCLHIAIATVSEVDFLVSWNFKHIVNAHRIRGYNCINLRLGYKELEIVSPKTVLKA
ncbi:putative nucleic acid-binding protein [Dyadobacter sp. BE34]|uniref:Nucleic acid-binding protein n=1 Tax=Dyadobacter fermentans TaxID=94254 RepID=A0ABU1R253_9BACT|nr:MULTISPECIES: type II toxin-antitoxin system VapC family toxin [Dyadobacter]MDR6807035.1 putative nucleic acid-binding protein [Dyadobacter fermentans]MDR7044776.1 putative nucleic acid-binding protein [Dyadobacter sp. BE242]MDR7199488.1 putative nucleic acid-binding protein [Dyadobacter sp. BE34]MDR7217448.1 putative nucleic acid-binding protein [Dyadobacter sp. BE31]MDR7265380.1 putative nucleic acid-binding protein [Dyadobacter sp. BE32]